jgi:sarcosine oxidase subunit beta
LTFDAVVIFSSYKEEHVKAFHASLALQHRLGVTTEWLKADEVRSRLPLIRLEDVLGATWNSQDGLVDPNSIVQGYIAGAKRLGAKCLTDVEVMNISLKKGRIHGVKTRLGEIETPIVVNAAGPWALKLAR